MIVFSRSLNVPEDAVIRILFIYQKTKRHLRQRIKQKRKRRGGGGGILVIVQHWILQKLEWIGNSLYINRILHTVLTL